MAALLALLALALIGAAAAARAPRESGPREAPATPPAESAPAPPSSAPSPPPALVPPSDPVPEPAGILADGRVILNLANEEELTKLPGIGPARARAILTLRRKLVRFRALEDLLRVRGIGRKTLNRIKPKAVLDRPAAQEGGGKPAGTDAG